MREALYEIAEKKWGKQLQMIVAMEELAELTRQISKWLRGKPDYWELASEVADVHIMLEQVEFLASKEQKKFSEDVQQLIKFKLQRLETRLKEDRA